jgi:hypothetical protein
VSALVRGNVRIAAGERVARDESASPLFASATALRRATQPSAPADPTHEPQAIPLPSTQPALTLGPATRPAGKTPPITIKFGSMDTKVNPSDGKLAVAFGDVVIYQDMPNGDFLQMQADRGIVFTQLDRIKNADELGVIRQVQDAVSGVYLEGDVRVTFTPADAKTKSEQRLEANRIFYDFTTDRAVLTDAVLHTLDPKFPVPMIVRADTLRQLSRNNNITEFNAKNVRLSTSAFSVPSFNIAADKAYVRQVETHDPRYGTRTSFTTTNTTLQSFGIPMFYFPVTSGSMTERGTALRGFNISNSRHFGFGVSTQWGLFETLGELPPADLDISYRLDYFSERGPAGGVNAKYGGGFITDTTKQPWNFEGDLKTYFVHDDGVDRLGRFRLPVVPEDEFRGRATWEHQHFFPDDWQVQLRASWISDATFMEEWYEHEFDTGLPLETSAYFKRQRDTEAFTLLFTFQPNDFVTTTDLQQEQFEIERIPEIGYRRIGDSLFDDRATFFSTNTLSALRFQQSDASLRQQGFGFNTSETPRLPVFPGKPSLGRVGVPGLPEIDPVLSPLGVPLVDGDINYRTDWRQELDFPVAMGQFKLVPYVMGRLTTYSDTPNEGQQDRWYSAAGLRLATTFWKVDDSAYSRLFDINRVRHVIEPEVNLFAAAETVDPGQLFIYDEPIDAISDFQAAQFALRQRWQTKRGAPGRQRSVDFFTFDIEANLFANQPPPNQLAPVGFRGEFFPSLPEASIPRNSLNFDATWRVSDTFVVLADLQHNLDENQLATASLGVAVSRDPRLSYFVGARYIEDLDSMIASIVLDYALTMKYSVSITQAYDFGEANGTVYTAASLRRKFDRFSMLFTVYHDEHEDEGGFRFAIYPEGLGVGIGSDSTTGFLTP